jgi:DNA-binding beta-propeller fold protein YncE
VIDTELAQGINDYLGKTSATACPETEHLINPEFELWERVDDTRSTQPFIEIGDNIRDMAFSPDGTLAYVLDQELKKSLVVIDAGCGQIQQKIPLKFSPQAFAISPDGTRAYVTDGRRIEVVDLTTNQPLADTFDLQLNPSSEQNVNDLVVSPDGARLYTVSLSVTPKANAIHVIDTASLESELTGGPKSPATRSVKKASADTEQVTAPVALAVSPEGGLLYLAIARDHVDGMVKVIDTAAFVAAQADIPVVGSPTDIALTPDGVRAVVSNVVDATKGNATVIETATGTSTTIDFVVRAVGVAISPDGALAYVFKGDHSVLVMDIDRAAEIETFSVPKVAPDATAEAIAICPIGDLLYTGHEDDAGNGFISPVQFGTRRPAEWQLTSGVVSPFCLALPFHLTAILGPDAQQSAMSQVTPVAQSCTYEFSFYAIASDSDADELPAMAEVIWLSSQCGFVGSEKVEITRLDAAPVFAAGTPPGRALFAASPTGGAGSMALHRKRLTPPAGADQAEIRFTAPSDGAAAIDRVSFMATSEASANSDFALQENGRLKDWTVLPAVAPGFAILSVDGEIHFRNASAATFELVQTVPAKGDQHFTVEIVGRTVASAASGENLRVEVRWLNAERTPTGSPAVIEVLADGLASSVGSGTTPKDATQAEIHLIVPGRTTQVVKCVSLRFSKQTIVPLTFRAESPGELTVSDVRVAFEQVEPTPPPIPDRGLCIPTSPGCEPGKGSGDSCFCHQCETDKTMVDKKPVVTSSSRPGVTGKCDTCGTKLLRMGGARVPGAEPFSAVGRSAVLQPRVIVSAVATRRTLVSAAARAPASLTDIPGIGEARARQLSEIGIDSVEKLAAATPETVAKIRFITLDMAARLVSESKATIKDVNQ